MYGMGLHLWISLDSLVAAIKIASTGFRICLAWTEPFVTIPYPGKMLRDEIYVCTCNSGRVCTLLVPPATVVIVFLFLKLGIVSIDGKLNISKHSLAYLHSGKNGWKINGRGLLSNI